MCLFVDNFVHEDEFRFRGEVPGAKSSTHPDNSEALTEEKYVQDSWCTMETGISHVDIQEGCRGKDWKLV